MEGVAELEGEVDGVTETVTVDETLAVVVDERDAVADVELLTLRDGKEDADTLALEDGVIDPLGVSVAVAERVAVWLLDGVGLAVASCTNSTQRASLPASAPTLRRTRTNSGSPAQNTLGSGGDTSALPPAVQRESSARCTGTNSDCMRGLADESMLMFHTVGIGMGAVVEGTTPPSAAISPVWAASSADRPYAAVKGPVTAGGSPADTDVTSMGHELLLSPLIELPLLPLPPDAEPAPDPDTRPFSP